MNILRAQQECLKAIVKESAEKPFIYSFAKDDSNTYICNGYKIEVIPNDRYFLNLPESARRDSLINIFEEGVKNCEIATDTHVEKVSKDFAARIFESWDKEIWVDKKLLKNFVLEESEFGYFEHRIYIMEDEKIVGIVMEITRNETL